MKVKELIDQMGTRAMDENFINTIFVFYSGELHPSSSENLAEKDYIEAMQMLPDLLTGDQMNLLHEAEKLYTQNRTYAAKYGFICGIYAGFRQYFTNCHDADGGFGSLVCEDLLMQPKMQRHHDCYLRSQKAQEYEQELTESLCEDNQEYIVSFGCAWEDRIYNAAFEAFYCGYRAAYALIEQVDPLSKVRSIPDILTLEYYMGYIRGHL